MSDGEIFTWAVIKECPDRDFSPFWYKGLVLIAGDNNYAKLVWGPNSSFATDNYYIYRAITSSSTTPPSRDFSYIGSTNSSTFEYTDDQFTIGGGTSYAHYFVKAYNSSNGGSFSSATNSVNTSGVYSTEKMVGNNSANHQQIEFKLNQNYPNPFNPSTTISYSIPKDGLTILKVFDVLGNEVLNLVNENKSAGEHSIEFNASELPSGIYFYSLTAGKYSATKKLILLK